MFSLWSATNCDWHSGCFFLLVFHDEILDVNLNLDILAILRRPKEKKKSHTCTHTPLPSPANSFGKTGSMEGWFVA